VIQKINTHSVENILKLLDNEWLGDWQRSAVEHLLSNPKTIIQMPRQTGKTYSVALVASAYILAGGSVIVGMPTLGQSKGILFRQIAGMVEKLRGYIGSYMKPFIDTTTEKLYHNGAQLRAISVDNSAQKEGWSADLLIIDEAHRSERTILGITEPYLTQAKLKGTAKIILLGVGGHVRSLIEEMKQDTLTGYVPFRVTPDEIIADVPAYESVFEDFKRSLIPVDYEQHILCLPVGAGTRYLFPDIQIATDIDPNARAVYYIGIDVGEKNDETVVSVLRRAGEYIDLVDVYKTRGDFIDKDGGQAARIAEFIKKYPVRHQYITIETNFNSMLFQSLCTSHFRGMNGIHLTYPNKKALSDYMMTIVKKNKFRVSDSQYKRDLESLVFNIKVNGNWEWSHSDLYSSILMAISAMQEPIYF